MKYLESKRCLFSTELHLRWLMLTASDAVRTEGVRSIEWRSFSSKTTKRWWMMHPWQSNHNRAWDPTKVFHLPPYVCKNIFDVRLSGFKTLKPRVVIRSRLNDPQVLIDVDNNNINKIFCCVQCILLHESFLNVY